MENLPKKVRSKKLSTRVDLTAMVSVSFLLIIFFMVVGELSKPKVMDLSLPERYWDDEWNGVISCGIDYQLITTILLDDNDKIVIYSGLLFDPLEGPKNVSYDRNGIRKELLERNKKVLEYSAERGKPGRGVTIIIKPSKKSNYGNLVDILDEMKITGINNYAIVDYYTPEESKLLASK